MRKILVTNVPYGTEQDERFLRAGAPAVSSFSANWMKTQFKLSRNPRKERGTACHAAQTTHVPSSATEPHELECFQPSMLCNRSLPIYLSDDRAVPPTSFEQMRGLTTCP